MSIQRKIIHIDCDCFFAAVEMRDNPAWRDIPLAVGGQPGQRGVIATCNYEARRYGVHSAMPSSLALRRCPALLIVPPDFTRYKQASLAVQAIYHRYSELIEPLSLDEAYLDVSGQPHCHGSASLMAEEIRAAIRDEVGITASAGIAPNKFLAKIASDWNKPDGQWLVRPQDVAAFVETLPVEKIWGVGAVTAARLKAQGLHSCGDLQRLPLLDMLQRFGKFGKTLYDLSRGIDHRAVEPARERKSVSVEETYPRDLPDLTSCEAELEPLLTRLAQRLQRIGTPAFRGLNVKIKFADFSQTTVELAGKTLAAAVFRQLLHTGFARGNKPVRLLGVGVRLREDSPTAQQLPLFEEGLP
ncbi:DNA polymerase IV [Vogesella sp. LYT5W]|uniref:DNA polymerase IV n=1 Tax=Vogesella margarita TaxID=2984199 RepID=A0ABT5IL69_9NEIS|nr:DNA polymerase IV [Vogesella margarita]MDC7713310.1 DNA polymerase IV [Vogesella margarita]